VDKFYAVMIASPIDAFADHLKPLVDAVMATFTLKQVSQSAI
jgi:hypothetical protein